MTYTKILSPIIVILLTLCLSGCVYDMSATPTPTVTPCTALFTMDSSILMLLDARYSKYRSA